MGWRLRRGALAGPAAASVPNRGIRRAGCCARRVASDRPRVSRRSRNPNGRFKNHTKGLVKAGPRLQLFPNVRSRNRATIERSQGVRWRGSGTRSGVGSSSVTPRRARWPLAERRGSACATSRRKPASARRRWSINTATRRSSSPSRSSTGSSASTNVDNKPSSDTTIRANSSWRPSSAVSRAEATTPT
jgi:hypothetical protein